MPMAARIGDATNHPGIIDGPGAPTVYIEKQLAARMGDLHVCALSPTPHPKNAIASGSGTVYIGKRNAARRDDICGCGATITTGARTVSIGP